MFCDKEPDHFDAARSKKVAHSNSDIAFVAPESRKDYCLARSGSNHAKWRLVAR
jgi:hypothetical protein